MELRNSNIAATTQPGCSLGRALQCRELRAAAECALERPRRAADLRLASPHRRPASGRQRAAFGPDIERPDRGWGSITLRANDPHRPSRASGSGRLEGAESMSCRFNWRPASARCRARCRSIRHTMTILRLLLLPPFPPPRHPRHPPSRRPISLISPLRNPLAGPIWGPARDKGARLASARLGALGAAHRLMTSRADSSPAVVQLTITIIAVVLAIVGLDWAQRVGSAEVRPALAERPRRLIRPQTPARGCSVEDPARAPPA